MSVAQELLTVLVMAVMLCLLFARVYKSEKLFSKLLITLILGFLLGLGYTVIKSNFNKPDVVKITNITDTITSYDVLCADNCLMYNIITPVVGSVIHAIPDYTVQDIVSTNAYNESTGFKLRQLKIRCRGYPLG